MFPVLIFFFVLLYPAIPSAAPPESLGEAEGEIFLIDFWASWCTPCRRSFPWMNEMQEKYADQGLTIIAVNMDSERDLAEQFLAEMPAAFMLRFDPEGNIAKEFGVEAMPTSYLLDSSGNVLARHLGFKLAKTKEYEAVIRAALANSERNL